MNGPSPRFVRAEYLISLRRGADVTGLEIATRALADALEEHWEEGAASRANEFIREDLQRVAGPRDPETGRPSGPIIYGFQIELNEEVESPALIIKDVSESLRRDGDVEHVLKFHDTVVEERNQALARELFALEMRMRRAITLIYLHAYGGTYYDLLRNDKLGTDSHIKKRMPKPEFLSSHAENEFFHLLFNHYGELNILRETRQLDDFIKQLAASPDFAAFQRELQRLPVEDEDDREFLNRIKRDLNPVEELRNCVMHNREPSDAVVASYETARDVLNSAMDDFFERWAIASYDDEMPWDSAAREAVEYALENADWNETTKTIVIHDRDDDRSYTIRSRDELVSHLADLAVTAFQMYVPFDGGEAVFDCDEYSFVEAALSDYEDRLEEFFREDEADEN